MDFRVNSITPQNNHDLSIALSVDVKNYIAASISENTKRAYQKWLSIFTSHGFSIPCNAVDVVSFLTTIKKADGETYSAQSLNQALAAIAYAHELMGAPNPTNDAVVKTVFSGFKRVHGTRPTRQAAPVKKDSLIEHIKKPTSKIEVRNNTLILIGFFGAFRRSELSDLEFNDVKFSNEGVVLTLKKSKTNQEGKLEQKFLPLRNDKLCPCKALKFWLEVSGIKEGKLFRNIKKNGELGESISPNTINLIIKEVFNEVETSGVLSVSGHSLRVGLITTCALAKIPVAKIQAVTGHKTPQMIAHYSREIEGFDSYPDI
jgi:integrase